MSDLDPQHAPSTAIEPRPYSLARTGLKGEMEKSERVPHWRLVLNQATITDAVLNYNYQGAGKEEDPYLVEWIPNDPQNPMNFPTGRNGSSP